MNNDIPVINEIDEDDVGDHATIDNIRVLYTSRRSYRREGGREEDTCEMSY